jgi:hypothetical protein
MSQQVRTFRVAPGRVVIPPKGLLCGPGGKPARFVAGAQFELAAAKVDRFIRNAVRSGDLVEVAPPPSPKKEG